MNRILLLCLLFFTVDLAAQDIAYGVEVGLNFNKFNGPAETDAQGAALETFKNTTGFHVGAGLRFKFLDRFGLNTQLQFSQKGGKVIFDGQALQVFAAESGQKVLTSGNRRTVIAVTNSYIDIPVMCYFKPNSKLELFAGANVGFLVGSTGYGEFIYNGTCSIDAAPI